MGIHIENVMVGVTGGNMAELKVWVMVGLPCSGKSTWIDTHLKEVVHISQDDIRRIFYGNQYFSNAEGYVRGDAKNIARLMLEQGKSIVVDNTAVLSQYRKEWKILADEYNAEFIIVFIDTPKEVCLGLNKERYEGKRVPDEVIEKMNNQFQRPIELVNVEGKHKWWDFGEEVKLVYVNRCDK